MANSSSEHASTSSSNRYASPEFAGTINSRFFAWLRVNGLAHQGAALIPEAEEA
jgi:hypothetical protein